MIAVELLLAPIFDWHIVMRSSTVILVGSSSCANSIMVIISTGPSRPVFWTGILWVFEGLLAFNNLAVGVVVKVAMATGNG